MKKTLIIAGLFLGLTGCIRMPIQQTDSSATNANTNMQEPVVSSNQSQGQDLQIEILKQGTGVVAVPGQTVTVHYVGTLTNGTKFDSSRDRGTPYTFVLGAHEVIEGWDKGVAGMKVGELRKLTIAPALGYGAVANGPIPANSTLVFEVELLKVE